ncbi:MAG: hypothetical protein IPH74_02830 [Bacteroidetes bacterium]|nr:hypothetical protein [Bacteroidota bacterium]
MDPLDVASPYDSLLKYDLHGCSFGDMDNDGFQDLYIITGQDFNELDETVKNILFKNNAGSFDFKNKIGDYVLENGKNRGRNVLWLDWDKMVSLTYSLLMKKVALQEIPPFSQES